MPLSNTRPTDHLGILVHRGVDVLPQGLAIDSKAADIQVILDLFQQGVKASRLVKVPHSVGAIRPDADEQRDLLACPGIQITAINGQLRLSGGSRNMDHRISGAAHRHANLDGVGNRLIGNDFSGGNPLFP